MIRLSHLQFAYPGQGFVLRLRQLEVRPGEAVAITGPSGCGKSTLLRLCAGILPASSGLVELGGFAMTGPRDGTRRDFRLRRIGLVFQEFDLLPYLNVRQNILAPLRLIPGGHVDAPARLRLEQMAARTGLATALGQFPHQLSGGEKQRTGICRSLIHQPAFLFADEPTSNLDAENQDRVLGLLLDYARDAGACLLAVSHSPEALRRFDRVEHLPCLLNAES